jgi:hypothetical protein
MDTVLEIGNKMEVFEFSVNGQVVEEKDQDPSIFVDIVQRYAANQPTEVKLFGEELKHRLEGHTFFFRVEHAGNRVRSILI